METLGVKSCEPGLQRGVPKGANGEHPTWTTPCQVYLNITLLMSV